MAQLKTITVDGITRNYLEYVPKNLGAKRPLLISCHGMNQDAAYQKGMLAVEREWRTRRSSSPCSPTASIKPGTYQAIGT